MQDLLHFLLTQITGDSEIEIRETTENGVTNFQVFAPQELMGIIIGKGGKTVKTLRNLLKIRATLEKQMVNLEVLEK